MFLKRIYQESKIIYNERFVLSGNQIKQCRVLELKEVQPDEILYFTIKENMLNYNFTYIVIFMWNYIYFCRRLLKNLKEKIKWELHVSL